MGTLTPEERRRVFLARQQATRRGTVMDVSRRDFLKVSGGAALTGTALGGLAAVAARREISAATSSCASWARPSSGTAP